MKYFEMFTGIAGFSKGIEQAYDRNNQHESKNVEAQSGRNGNADEQRDGVLSANVSALRNGNGGGQGMPECIGFSEIGKVANGILKYRYPDVTNYGDASAIVPDDLPDFDFLCGGFPCQAFSIAGKRQGFNEARGTLFFEIARILSHKRPGHILLENVEGLRSHESGETLQEILRILAELDYRVEVVLLNSKHYGVPQNRERIFFIGHSSRECSREILSFGQSDEQTFVGVTGRDIAMTLDSNYHKEAGARDVEKGLRQMINGEVGLHRHDVTVGTLRTHKDGEGFREMESGVAPTLNARARQDGSGQPIIAIPVLTPDHPTKRQNGRRFKENGDEAFTLTAQDKHGVMVAASQMEVANCVTPDAYLTRGKRKRDADGKAVLTSMFERRIRRLTPVECARLQGFPDDWADFGLFQNKHGEWHVREISDTGKYQVFGNAVTVNVIEAIVSRMIEKGCLD